MIPTGQPNPFTIENSHDQYFKYLYDLGVKAKTIVVVGGEPTLSKYKLEGQLSSIRNYFEAAKLELVTNGLNPRGLTNWTLENIDSLVISVYFDSLELERLWQLWMEKYPNINLKFRRHEYWEKFSGDVLVTDNEAQEIWENCWYRKHCTTIERGRIFPCSRIPKLSADSEGLLLSSVSDISEIKGYLERRSFFPSCKSCTPMITNDKIVPGVQPDDRLDKLTSGAIKFIRIKNQSGVNCE